VIGSVNGVRTIANIVWNRSKLNIRVSQPIRKNDRRQINVYEIAMLSGRQFFVLLEDDVRNIRSVYPSIALGGNMERRLDILGEPTQEHLKKSKDVLPCDGRSRHCGTVIGI
jgi:hypothetical protein